MTESPRHASSASDFRGMPLAAFLNLLGAYHLTFGYFFPTASGIVGRDYALALPIMLAEYFWFSLGRRTSLRLGPKRAGILLLYIPFLAVLSAVVLDRWPQRIRASLSALVSRP